jgi:2-C-methyl-D-erythritol 4-phosphate cytidylyltransferase/2-C-methyl-D-erythritol 2,4-cyclodiphosphate synthase
VIEAIGRCGAAAPAVPIADTLRIESGGAYELIDRSKTVAMQSPQGALRERLLNAHSAASQIHTDEIALVGQPFELVPGDPGNFKITTAADLERARAMVGSMETRTGIGYDIHPFSTDASRPLMLGGVRFEDAPGLEGHSDADVVIHAAVDALLGAAGLGDIGQHFPNTDPRWRGEPSLTFLRHAAAELLRSGWSVVNLDITMIAEKPKVMPRSGEVRGCLATALGIEVGRVSFKATTNEGLGSLGRGEGIAAHAVATIRGHRTD